MFSAMGIESRDGQLAAAEPEPFQRLMAARDVVEQPLLGDQIASLSQRSVAAQEKDPQSERFEQSERIVRSGQAGQHFGVADVGNAGRLNRFFVDRRRVDRIDFVPQSRSHRGIHVFPGRLPA